MSHPARWFVSSPHKVRVAADKESHDLPYGVRHARQAGHSFTACGEPALSWTMFWELPFRAEQELVCQACTNMLVQLEFGSRSRLTA